MIDQRELIWGIIAPPLLMVAGMLLTAWWPAGRRFLPTGALLALVFGICHLGFRGWVAPGGDVQNWPAWIAFAGGLLTCGASAGGLTWRVAIRLALTTLAVWLLLKPQLPAGDLPQAILWVGGLAVLWSAVIMAWERVHAASTAGVSAVTLTTLAALSAVSLVLFNCITHGQFAGILTAAATAALVLMWWRPTWYASAGMVTLSAVILPMLWLLGNRYADLPTWALPVLAVGGMAPLITAIAPARRWSDLQRLALVTVVAVLLVSPVLAWGVITSLRAAAESGSGY